MSRPLRALVADDEPMARARLCRLLQESGGVDILAVCENGKAAIAALQSLHLDVAFLDIHMPGADGFQVSARVARGQGTEVVYVTAHAEHAVRAFDAAAADYLLKPLSPRRLALALERLRQRAPTHVAAPVPAYPERLLVQEGARLRPLAVAAIDAVIAQANYVEVHSGGECARLRDTLAHVEAQLDPRRFVRVHRSRLVRIDAVRDLELLDSGQYLLRLHCGLRLGSGRQYRDRLRTAFGLGLRGPG